MNLKCRLNDFYDIMSHELWLSKRCIASEPGDPMLYGRMVELEFWCRKFKIDILDKLDTEE